MLWSSISTAEKLRTLVCDLSWKLNPALYHVLASLCLQKMFTLEAEILNLKFYMIQG